MAAPFSYEPFRTCYFLVRGLIALLDLIRYGLTCMLPANRPVRTWTIRQAVGVAALKHGLHILATTRTGPRLSLKPGREGGRFVVVTPASTDSYQGPLEDGVVKAQQTGMTWTPAPPSSEELAEASTTIILHFHGGCYVIGDGRDSDTGFLARTLLDSRACSHVCTPQYRLASAPSSASPFPAALQDAVTCYLHLVQDLAIPPDRIVLSGDSAGANLAIGLLRYLAEYGKQLDMPWPGAVTLWSPWVDVAAALDRAQIENAPNYGSDYIGPAFARWGATAITGSHALSPLHRYLSPLHNPFTIKCPMWVNAGGSELLLPHVQEFVAELQAEGNPVELCVSSHCPHDVLLVAPYIAFQKEARGAAKLAGSFLRAHRR